jgi:hypothetical protein
VQVFANHAAAVGQPLLCRGPFEFSNNRDDSQVLAATITVRPFTWYSCRSVLSTYETPVASPLVPGKHSRAMALVKGPPCRCYSRFHQYGR